ncbi:MAG TPA: type II toxin-antitoxin system RelE/ParE family toxin [Ignavibacteriaceae bacterium]|nr:type II toxin-antitoxin system RelE/ParE family toxin [Ignavibacteriaceae bacterium]
MPGKYSLRYLPVAEEDLISFLYWIAKDSPVRAFKFVDKLEEKIGKLEQFPLLGRVPRHHKLREYGYRVLMAEDFLVFYIIRKKTIEIHRITRASRNLDHLI